MSKFDRMYRVHGIHTGEAREFLTRHHYTKGCGRAPSAIYGLFEGSHLIGAMMLQRPGSEATCAQVFGVEAKFAVTGLHRLAILDVTPKNTESWFIARCFDRLKIDRPCFKSVLAFSDPGVGHVGTIYQASNAIYYGRGKREKRFRTPDGGHRTRRQCGVNLTNEQAALLGWVPVFDPPKFRYCFVLGEDKKEKRQWLSRLQLTAHAYPKQTVTSNGLVAA